MFRILGAGIFRSIGRSASFVAGHLKDFWKLLVALAGQARELGLAEFGKLAIDGTKVRANASKRKAMTYLRMKREQRSLEAEFKDCPRSANEIDDRVFTTAVRRHVSVLQASAAILYGVTLASGVADFGQKVDLVERSIRRGEGNQSLTEALRQDENGEWD